MFRTLPEHGNLAQAFPLAAMRSKTAVRSPLQPEKNSLSSSQLDQIAQPATSSATPAPQSTSCWLHSMSPAAAARFSNRVFRPVRCPDQSTSRSDIAPGEKHDRSEEHTSELQSRLHLVCRLLLEKKKRTNA